MRRHYSLPSLLAALLLVNAAHSLTLGQLPPRAAAAIASGAVHVERDFLSGKALEAARAAADELRVHGTTAVVGGGQDDTSAGVALGQIDTSVRDCATLSLLDVDLPLPLIDVLLRIDALRADLAEHTNRPLLEGPELQLLHYPAGGHYRRHVDEEVETSQRPVRRSISLLLYLTPPDWRTEVDGGALRVHRQNAAPLDVEPHAGTLVLFDSASVPHEVLPTRRERTVIVGWLMEDRGRETN